MIGVRLDPWTSWFCSFLTLHCQCTSGMLSNIVDIICNLARFMIDLDFRLSSLNVNQAVYTLLSPLVTVQP